MGGAEVEAAEAPVRRLPAVAETDSEGRRRLDQCWFNAYHGLFCFVWEIGKQCQQGGKVYTCKFWWYNRWEDGKHWDSWYRRLDDGTSEDSSVEDCLSECFGNSEGKSKKECHDLCLGAEVEAAV